MSHILNHVCKCRMCGATMDRKHDNPIPFGQNKVYAAVREGDNGLWIDTTSINVLIEVTREIITSTNLAMPDWAELHPVVRIIEFTLWETGCVPPPVQPPAPVPVKPVKPATAAKPAPEEKKAKRKGERIITAGIDCTDIYAEWERNKDKPSIPAKWLPNPKAFVVDKFTSKRLQAAMATVELDGEPVTLKCEDGGTIIVRRRSDAVA